MREAIIRTLNVVFAWFERALGIDSLRGNLEFCHRQQMDKLLEIQSQLNAIQVDKLKFYVNEKPKIVMQMDYESSQIAALDEFKENR